MPVEPAPSSEVWLIAHRGARDEAPENTAESFRRALDYPIDGIELDVQLSADAIPVIHHDRSLFRLSRSRRAVAELTLAQLRQLSGRGALPTLEAVLESFGGRTRLLIEIKSYPAAARQDHPLRLTMAVLEMLNRFRPRLSSANTYLLSFDESVLRLAHREDPGWPCVLNLPEKRPEDVLSGAAERIRHLAGVDVAIGHLTPELGLQARSRGLKLFTYSCNTPRQVARALQAGVDAILSDRPGWLARHLKPDRRGRS